MFFTDGSKINGSTGFGIFNTHHSISRQLEDPCSVYIAEMAAIYYALGIIETLTPDHYFIFTDSLSSLEAIRSMKPVKHSSYFLEKIRLRLSAIAEKSFMITLVWVPSHCSIPGNENADSLAKEGAMEGDIYAREIAFNEFFAVSRQLALSNWQRKWDEGTLGRWLHSITPQVSKRAWFKGLDVGRDFIRVMSRLMSNHTSLRAHSYRIGLAGSNVCECNRGYKDIEHIVWSCSEFRVERSQFEASLRARGRQPGVPVRDFLANRDFDYMLLLYRFIKNIDVII